MYNSTLDSTHIVRGARFMPCSITDEESGKTYNLNIREPKLKVYKKFIEFASKAEDEETDNSFDELIELAVLLLKNNKEGIKIDVDFVENTLGIEDVEQLFSDFTTWLTEARTKNPN